MTQFMEKKDIIMLKEQGLSNRAVSRRTSHDRKTVAKYWNEYRLNLAKLSAPGADVKAVQDEPLAASKYQSGKSVLFASAPNLIVDLKETLNQGQVAAFRRRFEKRATLWLALAARTPGAKDAIAVERPASLVGRLAGLLVPSTFCLSSLYCTMPGASLQAC